MYPEIVLPLVTLFILPVDPFFWIRHPTLEIRRIQREEFSHEELHGVLNELLR